MRLHINLKRFFIYLAILAISLVWASFYGGPLPFSTLFIIVLYPFYAFFTAFYTRYAFRLSQSLPEHKIKKENTYLYSVTVENAFIFPLIKIRIFTEDTLCDIKKSDMPKTLSLEPYGKAKYEMHLSCLYAGTYDIGIKHYEVNDPFAILNVRFDTYEPFRVIVRPILSDSAEKILNAETFMAGKLLDPDHTDEILGVDARKFVPGDDIRSIDQRRYARTDTLYVRLHDDASLSSVHIYAFSSHEPKDLMDFKKRDFYLEFTVSAIHWFIKRQTVVTFHYISRKSECVKISGERDLEELIPVFSEQVGYTHEEGAEERFRQELSQDMLSGHRCYMIIEERIPDNAYWMEAKEAME